MVETIDLTKNTGNKPVKRFSSGSIVASVFLNTSTENKTWYSVSIVKNYNGGTIQKPIWKTTNSYNSMDLPSLELVSKKAFEFINLKEN